MLGRPSKRELGRIFQLERHLITLRKVLSPQRDTLAMLARRGEGRVSEQTSHYFRDVYDQPGLPNWTQSDGLMHFMLATCALTPAVMVAWFRYRDWI